MIYDWTLASRAALLGLFTMKTPLLILATSLLVTGCFGARNVMMGYVADKTGIPIVAKVVSSKATPHTLIASDLTTCMVSPERFEKVAIGDLITCVWSDSSEGRRP